MNKKLFILFAILSHCQLYPTPESSNPELTNNQEQPKLIHEQPEFKDPVHLFSKRDFVQQLGLEEELKKEIPDESLVLRICASLAKLVTGETIAGALKGPQIPEIGHHPARKIVYSGRLTEPTHIALTFSGKKTLNETVESLKKERCAHNFLIDRDGSIHPATAEGESVEDALKHRPFALGISGKVVEGEYEERDMNAVSVTISVVGLDTEKTTEEQEKALIKLVAWLKEKFTIKAYNVIDYGTIALGHDASTDLKYGRRKTQENLPWQNLAEQGLTIWPKKSLQSSNNNKTLPETHRYLIYLSAALRKLGYITPITSNKNHPLFQQALTTFQKHYKCTVTNGALTEETLFILMDLVKQMETENPDLKNIWPPANLSKK